MTDDERKFVETLAGRAFSPSWVEGNRLIAIIHAQDAALRNISSVSRLEDVEKIAAQEKRIENMEAAHNEGYMIAHAQAQNVEQLTAERDELKKRIEQLRARVEGEVYNHCGPDGCDGCRFVLAELDRLLQREEGKALCKCGKNPADLPHRCPYQADINDNNDPEYCTCCEECCQDCIDEI